MIWVIPFCLSFAGIMYAHGMQWFDNNMPTDVNRLVSTLLMSALTVMAAAHLGDAVAIKEIGAWSFTAFLIYLWPGWMSYLSAALGENPDCPRWLGTLQMTLRECLILPCIAGICYITHHAWWPLLGVLCMGLPYLLTGLVLKGRWQHFNVVGGHALVGVIIGAMVWFSVYA